jgi:hypothetical protein
MEDGGEQGGDVVCLDDAPSTPDLDDVAEVNAPFVLLVCYVYDADSLHVARETGRIDCETQVFDESVLFGGRGEGEFGGEEGAMEGFGYVFALTAVGGDNAEIVSC